MCSSNRNQTLAERPALGGVSLCNCGTVHVSVGSLTLRLAPEAFFEMLHMCQDAAAYMILHSGNTTATSSMSH